MILTLPAKLFVCHSLPAGIKKDYSITEDSYKEVVQSLLESLQPGDVRIDTISPDCGLTALQLAIKRNWKTTALSLLSAGDSSIGCVL